MCGNPLAAVKNFNGARRDASPDLLAQQVMWRRVVVLLDLDVVIEPDPAFLPFGKDVGLGRQRLERRLLQLLEERSSARPEMPRHALIELCDQLGDGGVQLRQREEAPIAELRDDEARRHLNGHRKPRGRPLGLGPEDDWRLSFCCAVDGCRTRATPPSLRFLGRKVYLATIVVLVAIMREGANRLSGSSRSRWSR